MPHTVKKAILEMDEDKYSERGDGSNWPGGKGDTRSSEERARSRKHRRHHRGHRHRDSSKGRVQTAPMTKEDLDKLILETTNPFRSSINLSWTGVNWPRSSTHDQFTFGRLEQKTIHDSLRERKKGVDKIEPTASFGQHILPTMPEEQVAQAMPAVRPLAKTGTVYEDGKRRNIYGLRERGRLTAQNRQFSWKTTAEGNGYGSIDFKKCREQLLTSSVILPGCKIWKEHQDPERYISANRRTFVEKNLTGVYKPIKGEAPIVNDSATPLTLCPPTKNYSDHSARWTLQQTNLSSTMPRGSKDVEHLDNKYSKGFLIPGSIGRESKQEYGIKTLTKVLV